MSCSVRSKQGIRRARSARVSGGELSSLVQDGEKSRDHEIAGTWDFKWPLGSEIRVAFQKPPNEMKVSGEEFEKAVGLIVEYAKRWALPDTLSFDFLTDPSEFLEPPLGPANSLTDQHRSVFDLRTAQRIKYDVLVSVQDLPLVRVDIYRGFGQEVDHVLFPVSELGSYSRRNDFGAPTMYIGRFGHALKWGFLDYFVSALGQHVTVHEFGHALGIPHMHQHPDLILPLGADGKELRSEKAKYADLDQARADFYRPIVEVQRVIRDALGIEVTPDIVNEHLIEVFRGNKSFSDWVELGDARRMQHRVDAILDSVMTMPLYHCCAKTGKPSDCSRLILENIVTWPRPIDEEMLGRMYVPPPPASASEFPPSAPIPEASAARSTRVGRGSPKDQSGAAG